jgi:hypothetical protein
LIGDEERKPAFKTGKFRPMPTLLFSKEDMYVLCMYEWLKSIL